MSKIAVLSTNTQLNKQIEKYCLESPENFVPVFLKERTRCLEYLNYELPEISVFNFSDTKIKMLEILNIVKSDPWYHSGGIIGLHRYKNEERLAKITMDTNVISLIHRSSFNFSFPRILRILNQNRQFLFQRDIQKNLLTSISGSFVMDNDPFDMKTYSHLVSNYLFNANFVNREDRERLLVALMELLINAIEHGNCKISFKEKSAWLESGKDIFELIRLKNQDTRICKKKVYFTYRITPEKSIFRIKDEGGGFDWQNRVRKVTEKNYLDLHGRGIMMADLFVQNLKYNKKGNEVRFELSHQKNESSTLPQAFTQEKETVFQNGEIIFSEGEESNYLYYIVSGKLKIISEGKVIGTLSPDDLFLGEMSFLLNDRRSATVRSQGRSALLKISKESFINVVKNNPHYGIVLARLLAQRLERLNRLYLGLPA
jgi:anti-sigma regulatory factor (Ser/Thr protein kinase)